MALNAKLVVVGGEVKTAEIKLRLPSTIGRGRGTTIMLPHPLVSRQHCELFEAGGKLMVRDMGSLNGTFVNNQRVTESVIMPGELLTIGAVTFRAAYEIDESVATAGVLPKGASPSDTNIAAQGPLETALDPEQLLPPGAEDFVDDLASVEIEEVDPVETRAMDQGSTARADSATQDEAGRTRMGPPDPRATHPAPAPKAPAGAAAEAQKGITPPIEDETEGEDEDDLQDFLKSLQ